MLIIGGHFASFHLGPAEHCLALLVWALGCAGAAELKHFSGRPAMRVRVLPT